MRATKRVFLPHGLFPLRAHGGFLHAQFLDVFGVKRFFAVQLVLQAAHVFAGAFQFRLQLAAGIPVRRLLRRHDFHAFLQFLP